MFDIDDTIDAFRRGTLDFDCKRIVLAQRKKGGERFEGQGYVRQSTDGTLACKIYITQHNAKPFGHPAHRDYTYNDKWVERLVAEQGGPAVAAADGGDKKS